jgi:hypothetical protein
MPRTARPKSGLPCNGRKNTALVAARPPINRETNLGLVFFRGKCTVLHRVASVKHEFLTLSRASHLSGVVANEVSGRHSHLKEVIYETDTTVTGDTEDEI